MSNKLKKGLTYISERGSFYRYSDKDQDEKWLKPLTEYIPLEKVMRGQPVSIATDDDIKRAARKLALKFFKSTDPDYNESAEDNVETFNNKVTEIENLLNSNSNTFVVLTNPEIHQNTIGLSYEYNEGPKYTEATEEEPASIELPDTIHILELGRFDLDFDYLIKSHQETAENIVKNVINKEEYLPDFFRSPYRSIIGKQIYIKGSSSGELTIIPEEAYLGYNNIIKIGFIADAWINGNSISTIKPLLDKPESDRTEEEQALVDKLDSASENPEEFIKNSLSIQVQIQGDDRGALDSTILEGIVGEDVIITEDNPIRVFALGQEDDVAFSARINITPSTSHIDGVNTRTAFIGFQKMDGKTELISFGNDFDITAAKDSGDTEDAAFLTIANIYDPGFYENYNPTQITYINDIGMNNISTNQTNLANAVKEAWRKLTGWEMTVEQLNPISENATAGYIKFTSDTPGGYYYMYISSELHNIFLQDSLTYTNGSSNNKGKVVLADNRIAARQNVIGVYMSGIYNENLNGRKCIFLHDGLFRHNGEADSKYQEIGKEYFLGRHGFVTRIPDTAYETVVKIMDVQDENKVIIHCDNMRVKTRGGDLPLGYTKPAVKVGDQYVAEYGFVLMDGETLYPVDAYPALYTRLQAWFSKNKLDAENINDLGHDYFKIPLCTTTTEANGESTIMQIKAMEYGLYEKDPRVPFIRKIGKFEEYDENTTISVNGITYLKGNCVPLIGKYIKNALDVVSNTYVDTEIDTRFDITPICDLSIMENHIEEPSIESLDIRLYVDPTYNEAHSFQYHWVELRNGFQNFNNNTTYGFEWKIDKEDPTADCPFGRYFLSTDIKEGMGLYYQTSGNNAPTPLSGCPWKLVVGRHETLAQQYDLDGVMHAYLRNRVTDEENNPYTTKAVTGAAVIDAIENRYHVKNLIAYPGTDELATRILLGRETEPATQVELSSQEEIKIYSPNGIKFENSLKNGLYEENYKVVVKDDWISVEKGKNENNEEVALPTLSQLEENQFVTKNQVNEHINKDAPSVTRALADVPDRVVHGMIFGAKGNVDASMLNGLFLGTHHMQRVTDNSPYTIVDDDDFPSYIPYLYRGTDPIRGNNSNNTYIFSTEGLHVHNRPDINRTVSNGINGIYSVSEYKDNSENPGLYYEERINNNYEVFHHQVTGKQNNGESNKTLEIKYNFNVDTHESSSTSPDSTPSSNAYDFELIKLINNGEETPATLKVGGLGITSRIKYKRLYSELVRHNYNQTTEVGTLLEQHTASPNNLFQNPDPATNEYLGSALQAAYEVPLAVWQYKTEPNWYKKYIGIVIERVNDVRDKIDSTCDRTIFSELDKKYWTKDDQGNYSDPNSTKPFNENDNTFHYSEDEIKSIKTYLNDITDNAESAQNIISTVGLLLKAAKETQERLLKVEASTFGADAPTIPGQTKNFMFEETPDVTPEATHLGLNRLIRAMAIELYGTPNPNDQDLNDILESNNTSTTLSRIDELEYELEGKTFDSGVGTDAADNTFNKLSSATYPYAINEETSHGGVTDNGKTRDDYLIVTQNEETKVLTYHSSIENTEKTVTDEDVLYYLNRNDINQDYTVYEGDRVNIEIPDNNGPELYIKETIRDVLGNQNPIDGRKAEDGEIEDAENHGTWTKINFDKEHTTFEIGDDGKFIQDTAHNIVPEDERYLFNGAIDAISRICTKINALTYSINGKDNINSTPERLNTIRNNIETLIKEAYFDGAPETTVIPATDSELAQSNTEDPIISQSYIDEDLDHTDERRTLFPQPSIPYTDKRANGDKGKDYTGISRFDQLSNDLYNYVISGFDTSTDTIYTNTNFENNRGGDPQHTAIQYTTAEDVSEKGASKKQVLVGRKFNGKPLLVDGITDSSGADVEQFNQTHNDENLPHSFHINVPDSIEEYNYASIIDILIDALGTGYFRHQISPDNSTSIEKFRPTKTITERIERIEQALDNVVHKLSQSSFYESDTVKDYRNSELFNGSDSNRTYSIESFIKNLNNWLGLSTLSENETQWKQDVSAEVACGYTNSNPVAEDKYFLVIDNKTNYVDLNGNITPIEDNETFYKRNIDNSGYTPIDAEEAANTQEDIYIMRHIADPQDYLNNSNGIVNSNYVIKQLLKRLRREESYYIILKEILGIDYSTENAGIDNTLHIDIDPDTGLQLITGTSTYNLSDDVKDLLLTIYGTDNFNTRMGIQTDYQHRSLINDSDYLSIKCWENPDNNDKVFTTVDIKAGANVWKTTALETSGEDNNLVTTVTSVAADESTITGANGITYNRCAENDFNESSSSLNTRFTGNSTTRNIIDDIVKELYFVPDPIKYNTTDTPQENEDVITHNYEENPTYPVDSKIVGYDHNDTYYDIDSGNHHYDYEHNVDDPDGGATGKAIGYQNRESLFRDYKGATGEYSNYRRSRFEVLEDEIRHLRSFLGLDEIIDNNTIGNTEAAKTVYGGRFQGTSDTSLAGHEFSGGATRNGNFFLKQDAATDTSGVSSDSNLLTMVFNLSNALRDISRELGHETDVRGREYENFSQLNRERDNTIYTRLAACEDLLGNLLGIVNPGPNKEDDEEDDREDGVIDIQWIEE